MKYLKTGDLDKKLRENFNIPGYVFYQNCEIAKRVNLVLLSSIDKEKLAPMGITSYNDVNSLLSDIDFKDKTLYIIKKGGTVIPSLEK